MFGLMVLYACLDSPQFEVREAAEWGLIHRVNAEPWSYGESLARWMGGATSPEVARRVRRPVRIWDQWRVDSYCPKGIPVWPCCDFYPLAVGLGVDIRCRDEGKAWLFSRMPEVFGPAEGGPYWHRWRRATERMARQMIRDGKPPEQVDSLLQRMWRLELAEGSDCQKRDVLESWQGRPWSGGYPEPDPPRE